MSVGDLEMGPSWWDFRLPTLPLGKAVRAGDSRGGGKACLLGTGKRSKVSTESWKGISSHRTQAPSVTGLCLSWALSELTEHVVAVLHQRPCLSRGEDPAPRPAFPPHSSSLPQKEDRCGSGLFNPQEPQGLRPPRAEKQPLLASPGAKWPVEKAGDRI